MATETPPRHWAMLPEGLWRAPEFSIRTSRGLRGNPSPWGPLRHLRARPPGLLTDSISQRGSLGHKEKSTPSHPSCPAWPASHPPTSIAHSDCRGPAQGRSEVGRRPGRQASKAVKSGGKPFRSLSKVMAQHCWGPARVAHRTSAGADSHRETGEGATASARKATTPEDSEGEPRVNGPCPTLQEEVQD